jgi:hypothetical protein
MTLLTERELPLVKLLIDNHIADNPYRAGNIITGLKLAELETDEARLIRARLYRDARNSGIFHQKDTKSCFEWAIAGKPVPQALMPEALHSEVTE